MVCYRPQPFRDRSTAFAAAGTIVRREAKQIDSANERLRAHASALRSAERGSTPSRGLLPMTEQDGGKPRHPPDARTL